MGHQRLTTIFVFDASLQARVVVEADVDRWRPDVISPLGGDRIAAP